MPSTFARGPILIVEDDADSRVMLDMVLHQSGYATVTAANGADALRVAREHEPCLILLDLMMPVMDGREFRAHQLRDPALHAIPVILVTASHDAAYQADTLRATGCVQKPVDVDELLARVQASCRAPRTRALGDLSPVGR